LLRVELTRILPLSTSGDRIPVVGGIPHPSPWSPAIRLLVDRGHAVTWRPGAVAAALVARAAGLRAYTLWPSAAHPRIAADLGHPASAAWLRLTFEPDAPRRLVGPATWNALRTHGLVLGPPSRLITEAIRRGAGRDISAPRLALYSPTGHSKAACFVFEDGAEQPTLVVKAMPDPRHASRLRHETEMVETIRRRLGSSSHLAAALPLPPLFAGTAAGDYVVVQPVDPLAASTGQLAGPAPALSWLREFQDSTTTRIRAWGGVDTENALEHVRYAWCRARPASAATVIADAERLLRTLEGRPVRRCAVHGDFWRGNIAYRRSNSSDRDGQLRIYDWEWAQPEGTPFFDLWTTELGVLRRRAEEGEPELTQAVRDALARVASELERQSLDPGFARATLAPSLGWLVFRVRRLTGVAGGGEAASLRLMAAVESLLS
jgi:hypothetical protein